MKRFYCTVCKKVKRVRTIPLSVQNDDAETVTDRIGQCKWHSSVHRAHGTAFNQSVNQSVKSSFDSRKKQKVG